MTAQVKIKEIDPVWEAVKEPLRWLVLALIPFAIAYLTELGYEWATAMTLVLRFLDKYLHTVSKRTGKEGLFGIKGLTGF